MVNFRYPIGFLYSNLNLCKYSFELAKFGSKFSKDEIQRQAGTIQSPNIAPGDSGNLNLNLPANWKDFDVLYVTAIDQYGRHINTWSWNITQPEAMASRIVTPNNDKVSATETDSLLILSSGKTSVRFNKKSGLIVEVKNNNNTLSFTNGPVFMGFKASFKELKHFTSGNSYVVELLYNYVCHARWTMLPGGWLQLDYDYRPSGALDFAGVTFSYPENLVTGRLTYDQCLIAFGKTV